MAHTFELRALTGLDVEGCVMREPAGRPCINTQPGLLAVAVNPTTISIQSAHARALRMMVKRPFSMACT
jgi:hypothetical protein